jgi:hypothetical protein
VRSETGEIATDFRTSNTRHDSGTRSMEMDDRRMSESSMRGCRGNGRSVSSFIINLQVTQGPDVVPSLDLWPIGEIWRISACPLIKKWM